jgi:hypothetical protein
LKRQRLWLQSLGPAGIVTGSEGTAVRFVLVMVVLAALLVLATVIPAMLADRMQPTVFRTYTGPFEQPGRSRLIEVDLGRNPGQPLLVPNSPGTPPVPEAGPAPQRYLILLGVLVLLLALPAGLRRLYRAYGGT